MGARLFKTKQVCEMLGVNDHTLYNRLRSGILQQPERDCSGDLWWTAEDVERARAVLTADRRRREHQRQTAGSQD
jgi:predicted site-specific integrase-resolvase